DDGSYIYVTSHSSNMVRAVNLSQQRIVHSIPAGSGPLGVAIIGSRTPQAVTGIHRVNQFLNQIELSNVVSWDPVQEATNGYCIYRDSALTDCAGCVESATVRFEDHNLR